MATALPILWHFPVSHFNEKVRWALDFKRIPHRRRALFIDYLPRALWATGRPTLPILFLDGEAIGDSTRILEVLEERYPDPPLYPADVSARRRAVDLEDFFDAELGHQVRAAILGPMFGSDPDGVIAVLSLGMGLGDAPKRALRAIFPAFSAFYRYRHRINPATVNEGRSKILAALDRIQRERQSSGYLVGDRFGVADLAAASLLSPLLLPPESQYPFPSPVPPALSELRDSFAGHPAFRWAADMYARHRGASAEVAPGAG